MRFFRRRKGNARKPSPKASSDHQGIDADNRTRKNQSTERRKRVSQAVLRNKDLPRIAGPLKETCHGLFGTSDLLRWVVLDPFQETLSLWSRPSAEDQAEIAAAAGQTGAAMGGVSGSEQCDQELCAICLERTESTHKSTVRLECGHGFHCSCLSRWGKEGQGRFTCPSCRAPLSADPSLLAPSLRLRPFNTGRRHTIGCFPAAAPPTHPRKVFPLMLLEEVTSNPHFRNIFLRFEKETSVLILTADREEDYLTWMRILEMYESSPGAPQQV
mmetsp:Transcript_4389/g.8373  ORF Transcript_4389/g.8373 Transcript_4389/m.8373 type:complete len:272 (-) Transcript_4389:52-867(-)